MEFKYGDRVRKKNIFPPILGTVMDERLPQNTPSGLFEDYLPLPVAVAWDNIPGKVWWENGEDLELA